MNLVRIFVLLFTAWASVLQAQTFPSKPLRVIVPFPPGGAADITARLLGEHMTKGLGQPVVVENRPGGGAVIGYELGSRAAADGHTLLVVFPSFVISPAVRRVAFDPIKDFRGVTQTISLPMAIAVNPALPIRNMKDLIAYARDKPGELAYGTPGAGTTHHVIGEMLRLALNINITHAPFQGEIPAVTAVAGGHLPMVLVNASSIAPQAKTGRVRAIVVTTSERADVLPEVPTMREAGYPELESTNWAGIVVPAATPPGVIARLNGELVRALRAADVQEKLKSQGMTAVPGTAEQFDAFLQSEWSRYARVAREAGVKAD